ncbi:MAG: fluoride efflux transporter CrcB [Odoribacteraceae bacterium]|nr:fluoride efflux transporter CrcB [Odoribacteraceae bacterium]
MIKQLLLVGLGGGAGSMLRYLTSWFVERHLCWHAPSGTFIVNVAGCFLVGLLAALSARGGVLGEEGRLLFITGFCGGYTTFSTFSAENVTLLHEGNYVLLGLYAACSLVTGAGAVWLGSLAARHF